MNLLEVSDGHMFPSLNDLYQRCNCSKTISGPDIEIYLLPGPAARAVHCASLVTQSQGQGRGGKSWHPGTVRWEIAQEYLKFESQFSRIKKGFYDIWKNY